MISFELKDVSLSYPVIQATEKSMKSAVKSMATGGLINRTGRRRLEVRALENVNLSATEGERIGIIGHNGAGKTTLLKTLAGIYRPQSGSIRRSGRTVSVINPSMGLNQSLTGHENIQNVLLLYGLKPQEIRERTPDIESFTELGDFLDLPISTYSTGMRARLAFAVATSFHPDILIVDEHLATGDAHFIHKARDRMQAMMARSSILVLASHNMETVKQFCNRAVLMRKGSIVADGSVDSVTFTYQAEVSSPEGHPGDSALRYT